MLTISVVLPIRNAARTLPHCLAALKRLDPTRELFTHATGGLWVDFPRHPIMWRRCPVRPWVDLASADKKVLVFLALGAMYGPLLLLLPVYSLWLAGATGRRAKQAGVFASPAVAVSLAAMLLLKSAAMTAGRWWGTVKYGAIGL